VSIIEIYFDGCFAINFEIILNRYIGTNIVQQIKIFFYHKSNKVILIDFFLA